MATPLSLCSSNHLIVTTFNTRPLASSPLVPAVAGCTSCGGKTQGHANKQTEVGSVCMEGEHGCFCLRRAASSSFAASLRSDFAHPPPKKKTNKTKKTRRKKLPEWGFLCFSVSWLFLRNSFFFFFKTRRHETLTRVKTPSAFFFFFCIFFFLKTLSLRKTSTHSIKLKKLVSRCCNDFYFTKRNHIIKVWQKPGLTRVTQTPQAAAPRIAREPLLFGGFMRSDGVGGGG